MGELISKGGAGLIVDYGGDRSFSSSFRVREKSVQSDLRPSKSTKLSMSSITPVQRI